MGTRDSRTHQCRGRSVWTTPNRLKAALAGVVAVVAGVLILTGGAN